MREIADHAGVSLGLAYRYFANKRSLAVAALEWCLQQIQADLVDVDVKTRKFEILNTAIQTFDKNPMLWSLWFRLRLEPELQQDIGIYLQQGFQKITENREESDRIQILILLGLIDGILQHRSILPNYPNELVMNEIKLLFEKRV